MRRYFFSTQDGESFKDREGEELPDDLTAKREAVRLLGELLKDDPDEFLKAGRLQIVVSEAGDGRLITIESRVEDHPR